MPAQATQVSNLITVGVPIGTCILVCIVTVIVNAWNVKASQNRFEQSHLTTEIRLFNEFKTAIIKEIANVEKALSLKVAFVEGNKVSWDSFDDHRDKNDRSIGRVHERVEKETTHIREDIGDIKESIGEVKGWIESQRNGRSKI